MFAKILVLLENEDDWTFSQGEEYLHHRSGLTLREMTLTNCYILEYPMHYSFGMIEDFFLNRAVRKMKERKVVKFIEENKVED